jgi:hypothetical protein
MGMTNAELNTWISAIIRIGSHQSNSSPLSSNYHDDCGYTYETFRFKKNHVFGLKFQAT